MGRSISRWMISRGARTLVLVSRSGSATGKVKELITEAEKSGANVVVRRCNVADPVEVGELVEYGLEDLPPVRGVVHGAMVLHVSRSSLICSVCFAIMASANILPGCPFREDDVRAIYDRHRVQGQRRLELPPRPRLHTPRLLHRHLLRRRRRRQQRPSPHHSVDIQTL